MQFYDIIEAPTRLELAALVNTVLNDSSNTFMPVGGPTLTETLHGRVWLQGILCPNYVVPRATTIDGDPRSS